MIEQMLRDLERESDPYKYYVDRMESRAARCFWSTVCVGVCLVWTVYLGVLIIGLFE